MCDKNIEYFINKIIEDFGNEIKKYEPEYDLSYMFFGSFALLIRDLVRSNEIRENILLEKAKIIIEEMALSTNVEVKNLFMVGFLEVFADDNNSIQFARKYFNQEVNNSLNQILQYWGKII